MFSCYAFIKKQVRFFFFSYLLFKININVSLNIHIKISQSLLECYILAIYWHIQSVILIMSLSHLLKLYIYYS